jgi:hypothetical protein
LPSGGPLRKQAQLSSIKLYTDAPKEKGNQSTTVPKVQTGEQRRVI